MQSIFLSDGDRLYRNVDPGRFARVAEKYCRCTVYPQVIHNQNPDPKHPLMTPVWHPSAIAGPAVESTKRIHHEIGLKFGQIGVGAGDLHDG